MSSFSKHRIEFNAAKISISRDICTLGKAEICLMNFTNEKLPKNSCLKYLVTNLSFDEDVVGMAWLGSACEQRKRNDRGLLSFKSRNQTLSLEDVAKHFAHEISHNFGAKHDQETQNCNNSHNLMSGISYKFSRNSLSSCSEYCIENSLVAIGSNSTMNSKSSDCFGNQRNKTSLCFKNKKEKLIFQLTENSSETFSSVRVDSGSYVTIKDDKRDFTCKKKMLKSDSNGCISPKLDSCQIDSNGNLYDCQLQKTNSRVCGFYMDCYNNTGMQI